MSLTLDPEPTDTTAHPTDPGGAGRARPGSDEPDNPADKPGSLLPAIRAIPAAAYENPTWKGMAYVLRDAVIYLLVVWGLTATDNPLLLVPLWAVAGLVVAGLFVIAHDAAHEALFRSKRLNSWVGHLAMLPSWHVYEGWVLGHNRVHHKYTVREGMDFVWHPYTAEQYLALSRWQRARHRLEWSWLGAGAYYAREIWWHKMVVGRPPKRWQASVRRDRWFTLLVVGLAATALAALGFWRDGTVLAAVWMPVKVLVVPFAIFCYVIGSFVHVHHIQPGIRWWPRREWTKFKGQVEGTTVLRAPLGLNFFFHWIMVHLPHHVDVRVPMYNLEMAADAIKAVYPDEVHDEPLRFRDFIRNTRRCKLYDFQAGRWMTYAEATAASSESSADDVPASSAA